MAQINFRVDDDIKRDAEQACSAMGLSMSAAINVFLTKVAREKRIPFELSADPFFSASNIRHLEKVVAEINAGTAKLVENDIIEVD